MVLQKIKNRTTIWSKTFTAEHLSEEKENTYKEKGLYVCLYVIHLYSRNWHNSVKQLYSKWKIDVKKEKENTNLKR